MQIAKRCFKYILTFGVTTFFLTCLLVFAAMIPRSAIKANIRESAVFLCEGELFGNMIDNVNSSKIDRYADSILLSIAYQYDSDKPLDSVMWSSYYFTNYKNENYNLLDAVTGDLAANKQYVRYWHGSNAIVRPLLVKFNIKQIYLLNCIILTLLVIILLAMLIRHKAYTLIIGLLAGLTGTAVWFVPLSLEYIWTFLLMLMVSIVGVYHAYKGRSKKLGILFLVSGMATCYLDFLSTETITFTVPLLLVLWIQQREEGYEGLKTSGITAIKSVTTWGFGYVGMWLMKWLIASVVLRENIMPYVSEHIGERLGGDIGLGPVQYIFDTLFRNIKCLFPFEYGVAGAFLGIAIVIIILYIGYVYHGSNIDAKDIMLFLIIGLIPYIRYVVLRNHSYIHYFFTYRAQLATIISVVIILDKLVAEQWQSKPGKFTKARSAGGRKKRLKS